MRALVNLYADDGTKQTPGADGATFTLVADTYFAEFFDLVPEAHINSVHWKYNAALVATITIEASNRKDVTPWAATASGWATTSAATASPAASAGEVVQHYNTYGAGRMRAKIVVATGGTLRGDEHGKRGGAL